MPKLTLRQIDRTYHPRGGVGMSESLKRARQPFIMSNLVLGTALVVFIGGVYAYSISAVKQDDFSDVEDLLPPLEQRALMKSIEDELAQLTEQENGQASPASALSMPSHPPTPRQAVRSTLLAMLPRRLDEYEWVKNRGWVEHQTGNVLVWGAPNVDNVGRVQGSSTGPRLV